MNRDERIKDFFTFESSLSDEELEFWDLFRYDLFDIVVYNVSSSVKKKKKKICSFISNLLKLFKQLISIPLHFIKYRNKRILFTCSRYKIGNDFIDVNVTDIYDTSPQSFYCIDTFNSFDYIFVLYSTICKKMGLYTKPVLSSTFINKINDEFSISLEKKFFEERIISFFIGCSYYKVFFKILKPKSLFFVQNGIRKDYISAAKQLQIPTIEVQHGEIGPTHPAYCYSKNFKSSSIIAADYLLVYSVFWKNRINFPGTKTISIGNSYYFQGCSHGRLPQCKKKSYDFTIMASDPRTNYFFDVFLQSLLDTGYTGNVCYKLHPCQLSNYDLIKERWSPHKNIDIILFEKNAIDVIHESNAIFAIHTTVIFQALDSGCKVLLYTIDDSYLAHKDVFNHPNLYLINDISSFFTALHFPVKDCAMRYYDDFDPNKFKRFLEENNL